jgi:hypothetical protein
MYSSRMYKSGAFYSYIKFFWREQRKVPNGSKNGHEYRERRLVLFLL